MAIRTVSINAELAGEYLQKYREVFQNSRTSRLEDKQLLEAFIEDRLREELQFLEQETDSR